MTGGNGISRRAFLEGSGALVISFSLGACGRSDETEAASLPGSLARNPDLDSWIRIGADGRVTVMTGKVEIGQGIKTALVQIAADELDVPLESVSIITADTGSTPDEGYTSGSNSIQRSGTAVRYAAAEAREILLKLASERLGVSASRLRVEDGRVLGGERVLGYGELVSATTLRRRATGLATPKPPSEHRFVGKPVPRIDIPGKVFAEGSYIQDLRLEGMVHARVVRPPSYAASLVSVDEAPVRAMPGVVEIVRDGSFLAVVAEREEQAIEAAEALWSRSEWNGEVELPPQDALADHLRSMRSEDSTISEKIDPESAKEAVSTVEASYSKPFIAHASIGPSCALARQDSDLLTVWTHGQGVFPLRSALSKVLAREEGTIRVVHMDGAGCYGHNGADDAACDAALVAVRLPGRAVRLQWMREDEHGWEPFGSAMSLRLRGAVDADGNIVSWLHEIWSCTHSTRPGGGGAALLAAWHVANREAPPVPRNIPQPSGGVDRNAVPLYELPHRRVVEHFIPEMPVRVSALRALGGYANSFAIESFMDELAHAAKVDPLEIRLRHLKDERARAVLEAVAKRAGWGKNEPAASGVARGRGLAFSRYKNMASYIAIVADVEVDASGKVRVSKATAAVDAGQCINPDGLRNQIEGGMVQSTSWTLKEAVTFEGARITSRDWGGYPILRFDEVPEVDVEILDRPDEPPLGAGETAQGPMAAAIANAVFAATGIRARDLPIIGVSL